MKRGGLSWLLTLAVFFFSAGSARAEEVRVAVAANFASTLEALAPLFQQKTGHSLLISAGSSGGLYAQIEAGAPFDVFLSADAERPLLLEKKGLAVAGTRFVYAQGQLVLWSPEASVVDAEGKILEQKQLGKVGLADPSTAPYGAAAEQVMSALGVLKRLQDQQSLVLGSSVSHAYQFAASGNAVCAFVAWSQVLAGKQPGSVWRVPQRLYTPLLQEAVLLKTAAKRPAARAFLRWLAKDPKALALLRAAGYERPKQ